MVVSDTQKATAMTHSNRRAQASRYQDMRRNAMISAGIADRAEATGDADAEDLRAYADACDQAAKIVWASMLTGAA